MTWKQTLLASCLFGLLGAAPAQAGPHDFVAYVTRLGGDSDVAQPYIDRFTKTIEAAMGWQSGSAVGKFFSTRKDTVAYIDSQKPVFGLMEPSLYLELRKERGLEPVAQTVSPDLSSPKLHVVVKDPAIKSVADLQGKRLFTALADAPRYLTTMIFAGTEVKDAATFFQLKPTRQAMRGVYAVLRGDAEATLLDDEQLAAARKIEGGQALRSLREARGLPPLPLVVFGKVIDAKERAKLTKVLHELCGTATGGPVCKEMRIVKFAPVDSVLFREVQQRYDGGKP